MSLHYGLLLLLCAVITVHCERLENHSFEPPFDEIEAASGKWYDLI